MAAALGFHRGYFGLFSHPPHANFDSLSSGPVFGVHHIGYFDRIFGGKWGPPYSKIRRHLVWIRLTLNHRSEVIAQPVTRSH
jgi:hypothetical protein